jgi:hypothetical protein
MTIKGIQVAAVQTLVITKKGTIDHLNLRKKSTK